MPALGRFLLVHAKFLDTVEKRTHFVRFMTLMR
jgi:hypothetical protein